MFICQATTIGVSNLKYSRSEKYLSPNPIQDVGGRGVGVKSPLSYQFFPCNFYKRRI